MRTNQNSDSESRENSSNGSDVRKPVDTSTGGLIDADRQADVANKARQEFSGDFQDADRQQTQANAAYADDDKARQQNNSTNTTNEGREVNRPNASNTRQPN